MKRKFTIKAGGQDVSAVVTVQVVTDGLTGYESERQARSIVDALMIGLQTRFSPSLIKATP